ncbi:hypothetical protein JOD27_007701 [Lentzea nigeriaca]|nr:hypothetical protein [Lentzea nigeriaca]
MGVARRHGLWMPFAIIHRTGAGAALATNAVVKLVPATATGGPRLGAWPAPVVAVVALGIVW